MQRAGEGKGGGREAQAGSDGSDGYQIKQVNLS